MVTCAIRISEKNEKSEFVSIQQNHVELYVKGQLYSIILWDKTGSVIKEYKDQELSQLIGSAISRGRRKGINAFNDQTEFYFLGNR
jgi:hypothetical protein